MCDYYFSCIVTVITFTQVLIKLPEHSYKCLITCFTDISSQNYIQKKNI